MSYSTPAMVRQALVPSSDGSQPNSADPTNTAADLSDQQLQDAINEADSTIDSYIGRYYAVPVDTTLSTPHPIDFWSRNIASYLITISYRGSQDFTDTDPVARRYNATMTALTDVSQGRVTLQLPDNDTTEAGSGAGQAINPYIGTLFPTSDYVQPDFSNGRGMWYGGAW